MDRTAWIVVTLCVIGLAMWTWWTAKQMPPRPASAPLSTSAMPLPAVSASAIPSTSPAPAAAASATPVQVTQSAPAFAEKTETLRNDDVELRLTNRGGGIAEAVLLNHIGQGDEQVVINSKDQMPIGAMVEQPAVPKLDEFALSREPDGSIKCEQNSNSVTIRKRFFLPPSKENKDNFLAEMDVDLVNGGEIGRAHV